MKPAEENATGSILAKQAKTPSAFRNLGSLLSGEQITVTIEKTAVPSPGQPPAAGFSS